MRRRRDEWADAGHGPALLRICLTAYDQIIGLDLDELAVDGCITKAPCGALSLIKLSVSLSRRCGSSPGHLINLPFWSTLVLEIDAS